MPAALNIQPLSRSETRGLANHNFRIGEIADHVDPHRSHLNRVLHGSLHVPGALGELPKVQPDTGRKIRKDARLSAAVVCTFPKELDQDQHLDAWVGRTMDWLHKTCPGKVAYAVLHMDETRPHIQAGVLPVDETGHVDYKRYFGSPEKLSKIQGTYSRALHGLGVRDNSPEVKEMLAADYIGGKDGWKARKQLETALEGVRARERLVGQREEALKTPELGAWRPPRRGKKLGGLVSESNDDYDKRLRGSLAKELQRRQQNMQIEATRVATRAAYDAYYKEKRQREKVQAEKEALAEKCAPYLEAIKGLPGRLVTAFNGFLESVRKHVQKEDRENEGQGLTR